MSKTAISTLSTAAGLRQKIRDYGLLVKFRLTLTVVFSAVMAYAIAAGGVLNWTTMLVLSLGGFLVTAAANALNEVLEKNYDKLMKRTANRPLAAGRMTTSEAVMAAGFMSLAGISLLALLNPWAVLLGTISLISYAFVYTPIKRVGAIAVFVGAIPGALPMMIGVVAAEGTITELALILFGIQFMWQFPHFWAIGWLAHEDYTRAGFSLLPSKGGQLDKSVGMQSLLFVLMLIPISLMPYFIGLCSFISAILLAVAGLVFAYAAYELYARCDRQAARRLMFCSLLYLPLILTILLIDKLI